MSNLVKVFALGGLDERGKNMYVVEINNDIFVIDAGMKYPEKSMPGIDFIIPDVKYLEENKHRIKAYIITHAHTDAMNALPFIINKAPAPVYTSRITKYFIEDTAKKFLLDVSQVEWKIVNINSFEVISGHKVAFYGATHSISENFGVAINTTNGYIIYSSDFIFDFDAPRNFSCDLAFMGQLAREGVLMLLCESLDVEHNGFTSPSHRLTPHIEHYFLGDKRLIISQYTQSLYGILEIINLAKKYNKKILFYSREMQKILEDLVNAKIIDIPKSILVDYPYIEKNEDVVIIMTGIGQRIFRELYKIGDGNKEKRMQIRPTDLFIIATPAVAGLEAYAASAIDSVFKTGARVVNLTRKKIVNMHAHSEDIKMLLNIFKPKYYMPVKGEYRHLLANAQMAVSLDSTYDHRNVIVFDNGMVAKLVNGIKSDDMEMIPVGDIMVDGLGVGDVGGSVLEDRQRLADSGIVILGISIDKAKKEIIGGPDIQMRGLIFLKDGEDLVRELTAILIGICDEYMNSNMEYQDCITKLREKSSHLIRKFTGKEPIIVPAIIEL